MRLFVSGLRNLVRRPATYVTYGLLAALLVLIIIAVGATGGRGSSGRSSAAALSIVTFPGAYDAILAFILGPFGAHRFYAGKIGTGILMLCTLGGLGVWLTIDIVMLAIGKFRDKEGNLMTEWT